MLSMLFQPAVIRQMLLSAEVTDPTVVRLVLKLLEGGLKDMEFARYNQPDFVFPPGTEAVIARCTTPEEELTLILCSKKHLTFPQP